MKNVTLIGLFALTFVLCGFVANTPKNTIKPSKTIKIESIKDTIVVDTIDFNLNVYKEEAHASYYHDKFTGRKTASGKIFNNNELTCAHKKLPFGTKLKVTSLNTNKSVRVVVTDRGPFTKGRDIDLSKKAFMNIAPKSYGGSIKVKLEIIKDEE